MISQGSVTGSPETSLTNSDMKLAIALLLAGLTLAAASPRLAANTTTIP